MVDKIEENKVYKCIPKESFTQEVYIGYLNPGKYCFIALRDRNLRLGNGSGSSIDYRSNHSFSQQNTFEATEEETNWFLKCVELNKYISLEDFRELQPKYKELNPYNI